MVLGSLAVGTAITGIALPAAAADKGNTRYGTVGHSAFTGHTPLSASQADTDTSGAKGNNATYPQGVAVNSRPGDAAKAPGDAAKAAGYLKQWMFDTNHPRHPLRAKPSFSGPADRNYNLWNIRPRKFLQYEKQTFGINLGWTDDASSATAVRVSRWFFTRSVNDSSPLHYGDKVAMGYGNSPSYIYYAKRTFGINLNWSSRPVFEWKILGGRTGQQVPSNARVALYNQKAGDCLIEFDRTVGGDIGWPSSETWGQQIKDAVMKFIRDHWKEGVAYLLKILVAARPSA